MDMPSVNNGNTPGGGGAPGGGSHPTKQSVISLTENDLFEETKGRYCIWGEEGVGLMAGDGAAPGGEGNRDLPVRVCLGAAGKGGGVVHGWGERLAMFTTGDVGQSCIDQMTSQAGIVLWSPMSQTTMILHGDKADLDADSGHRITLADDNITIDAGMGGTITLRAGQSKLVISPAGISLHGPLIKLNCDSV